MDPLNDVCLLLLHRPHFQCSSTCPCLLNRSRNRQRSPATCLHLFMSYLFKPMPMARPVVGNHSKKIEFYWMECKHWMSMIYLCFYFRQEPKCLNQWWCGWGQGPVQTSRWFPGYKHYYICLPSCMQLLHLCCAAFLFDSVSSYVQDVMFVRDASPRKK